MGAFALILYDCAPAPNPRRVRFFAAEKGISLELVAIDLNSREQLTEEFSKINPRCTVPVLETDAGEHISEAIAICDYLEAVCESPRLLGRTPIERARVLMWTQICETDGFAAVAEAYRNHSKLFENRSIPGAEDYPQIELLSLRGRQRTFAFLRSLDERLRVEPFLAGEMFSLADITAFVTLDFAKWIKVFVTKDYEYLHSWYQRIGKRPATGA